MNDSMVIIFFDFGFAVQAVGLTHKEAHNMREKLIKTTIFKKVGVGKINDYWGMMPPPVGQHWQSTPAPDLE